MPVLDEWMEDMPEQFCGKEAIEIVITAFANQLQEINDVFEDMEYMTDLNSATGVNLDNVGNILSLSRKDAKKVLRDVSDIEIDDEIYRRVLYFQSMKNNTDCSYKDIMESMRMLWDAEDIEYVEDPEYPATIFIELKDADIEAVDPTIGRILAIKPAGVDMIYTICYVLQSNFEETMELTIENGEGEVYE